MTNGDRLIYSCINDQEKKRKAFDSLTITIPARTAAGGYAGSKRWSPVLVAGVVVTSLVVLIGRLRLDRP